MKHRAVLTGLMVPGLLLAVARVDASGFQLQEQTASGLGVAYSGMQATAQDAGVVFWNPAAMPLLKTSQLAASMHYIDTSFEFVSAGPPPSGSTWDARGEGGNAGGGNWVPAVYGTLKLKPRLFAGLAVDAPFGLKTQWQNPWAGSFYALTSEVKTLNINPTVGYRLGRHVLLGGGMSYQRLTATLTSAVTPLVPMAEGRIHGDDWAYGWNAGALFEWGRGTRIGMTYRSGISYAISGDLVFDDPALAALGSRVEADIRLPPTAAIALSQELHPRLHLLADYTWTGWDSIQSLTVIATSGPRTGQPVQNVPLNFHDSWRAGLGLEYVATPAWTVRAGLAYDRSPVQDAFRTPRLPDDDRRWLSIGMRFQPNANWSFDAGYAHLWVQQGSSNLAPSGVVPGALRGSYDSSSNVFAVQMSMRFK
jgi:long-chain fatty acid transport protein